MSDLVATVTAIESVERLHRVRCLCSTIELSLITLELGEDVFPGTKVKLTVKPSHVGIGKQISGELSFSNLLDAKILSVENGQLLSRLILEIDEAMQLESVITKNSVEKMDLKEGEKVIAIIKASDLGVIEVMDV